MLVVGHQSGRVPAWSNARHVCSADDGHVDAEGGAPGERPQIASAILGSSEDCRAVLWL